MSKTIDGLSNSFKNIVKVGNSLNDLEFNVGDSITNRIKEMNEGLSKLEEDLQQAKDDFEEGLQQIKDDFNTSENIKYSTINGACKFECVDGYVDNIYIEGKTLVNLADFDTSRAYSDGTTMRTYFRTPSRISNGTYTVFNNSNKEIFLVTSSISTDAYLGGYTVAPCSKKVLTFNSDTKCYGIDFGITQHGWVDNTSWYTGANIKAVILEGSHLDKDVPYFEGINSIGQNDITFLSYRSVKKLDLSNVAWKDGYYVNNDLYGWDGTERVDGSNTVAYSETYIPVEGNKTYLFLNFNWNICFYDANKQFLVESRCEDAIVKKIDHPAEGHFIRKSPANARYVRVTTGITYKNRGVAEIHEVDKYEINKAKISSNPLCSSPYGAKDVIEKRGNRYFLIKRCKEITLTGEEDWVLEGTTSDSVQIKSKAFSDIDRLDSIFYCDKEKCTSGSASSFGIKLGASEKKFFYRIPSNRLATKDVNGAIEYLRNNPLTIVYQMQTPTIHEIANINSQAWEGETTLIFNTGAVPGECNFEVTSNLGSELDLLKDKVNANTSYLNSHIHDDYKEEKISLFNGWTTDVQTSKVIKQGNVVNLILSVKNGTTATNTTVGSMSSAFAPSSHTLISGLVCDSNYQYYPAILIIGSSGKIAIDNIKNLNTRLLVYAVWETN